MAANIFNTDDFTDLKKRIKQLEEQSPRQWGKMTVDQMIAHCTTQLKIATGMIEGATNEGPFIYRTALGRWFALYVAPWPKGSATPSQMDMHKHDATNAGLEPLKQELLELLELVQETQYLNPHPFFGKLNRKDWGRLIWKHFDHHLRQFGH